MSSPTPVSPQLHIVVLLPLRDDWASVIELIRRLDNCISRDVYRTEIVVVDDASIQACDRSTFPSSLSAVRTIKILRLRRNLGHQRAIAIGLMHIKQTIPCDAVVVMDADGEDTPEGLAQLLSAYSKSSFTVAIFAERSLRVDSLLFQSFYVLYRTIHRALTGISVRVGNFSILPCQYLSTLSVMPELWSHYAAAVFRSKLIFTTIPIPKGRRIAGKSRMNFVELVSHGLSAISVFGDIVGVRLLFGSLLGALIAGFGIVSVIGIRIFTDWAIPGWAPLIIGVLAVMLIQFISIATSFTFFVLANRFNLGFLPARDYSYFVAETMGVYPYE
jgi:glycosyltransferase involved in cell wall biosynthesis